MGVTENEAVMVGDSVDSDIRGARRIGMTAVLFAPQGGPDGVAHYMVRSMAQLRPFGASLLVSDQLSA